MHVTVLTEVYYIYTNRPFHKIICEMGIGFDMWTFLRKIWSVFQSVDLYYKDY